MIFKYVKFETTLREYIRNVLKSPVKSDREQLGVLGKGEELGSPDEMYDEPPLREPDSNRVIATDDPYVSQHRRPTGNHRKIIDNKV